MYNPECIVVSEVEVDYKYNYKRHLNTFVLFSKLYHHLGRKKYFNPKAYVWIFSGLFDIVAVSATVSVSGNLTRSNFILFTSIERLSTGNVVLSHRYPCKCDSTVGVQPSTSYYLVKC